MATGTIKSNNWVFQGRYQGTTAQSLPPTATEYFINLRYGTSGGYQALSFPFSFPNSSEFAGRNFTGGYYLDNNSFGFGQISVNTASHTVSIVLLRVNGVDYADTSCLEIFYR